MIRMCEFAAHLDWIATSPNDPARVAFSATFQLAPRHQRH
jgi:hypothetical protein